MKNLAIMMAIGAMVLTATAGAVTVKTETLKYTLGDRTMIGYVAYPTDLTTPRPAVLVVHEWYGLNAYAKRRAEQLAALGYVALAVDMYGDGKVAADAQEAARLATTLKQDRAEMRKRARAGLDALQAFRFTDTNHLAAIGFCFGGTTALELARSGAPLDAVVSFHGGLDSPHPDDGRNIKASLLICHGANDPFESASDMNAFQDELRKAGVDWQLVLFGNAVHSFSNPEAGNDPAKGAAYNEKAERRSWDLMQSFLRERFAAAK